jgi:PEGA domain
MSRRSEALALESQASDYDIEPCAAGEPSLSASRRQQQPVAIIRIARLWPGGERAAAAALPPLAAIDIDPVKDSLDAFGSEGAADLPALSIAAPAEEPSAPAAGPRGSQPLTVVSMWLLITILGATAGATGVWAYRQQMAMPTMGSLTIQTSPSGLPVGVDGRSAGVTPVTLTLTPASYRVQVGEGSQRRDLTVSISAGSTILQHLEIPAPVPTEVATTGALRIQTEPAGQMVNVDGVDRGASPLTIQELTAGDHTVLVRGVRGTVRRTVAVKAGETFSLLVAPVAPSAPAPGWLSVHSPSRLEIREGGKLLGTTETEQIMLPSGHHEIELANDAVGYRSRREVEVAPGQVTSVPVELPYGALSINAQPWAEVWINGERVGETPIANLARRIGTYDVVFRHPEFGERRETVNVTLRQPVRLGVDMRSRQQ